MDKWFRFLNETRSSPAGIRRSIKTLTDMGGNTGGNPMIYRMDDPLQGKKKSDISALPVLQAVALVPRSKKRWKQTASESTTN